MLTSKTSIRVAARRPKYAAEHTIRIHLIFMGLCAAAMRVLALLVLTASTAFLAWFWFAFIDTSFDAKDFADDANTTHYVFFIGTFAYVLLMHSTGLFVDTQPWPA